MFLTWRRSPFFVQMPLCDAVDDGGGGGDGSAHPEYDIDDLTVDDNAGDEDDDPSRQPGAPAGRLPVQDPARRPAGESGQEPRTPQSFTPEQYNQVVTGYRSLQTQNQQLAGQLTLMQRQIAALTGQQPPAATADDGQPQYSEADQKAIKAVLRLFPGLKPLLDKSKDLLELPDVVQGFRSAEEARWQDNAVRTWDAFDVAVKAAYGDRQLHPFAKQQLDAGFVSWLETDKNAAARYRMGDTALAKEFVTMYFNGVVKPARAPQPNAGGAPRRPGQQQQQPRVPRGGAGGTVPGQRPAQPQKQDVGALHDAAADAYFAARG